MARSKRRRKKTRKHRSKRGGNGGGHRTGLGDGDNRKIDQYLREENIRIHDAQDPRVLDEAALIEAGDVEAIARRDAAVEVLQRRLADLAGDDDEDGDDVPSLAAVALLQRRLADLAGDDEDGDVVPSLAELQRRFGARVGGVVPAHVPVAPVELVDVFDDLAGRYDDLPLAPRAHEGGRRRRKTRKRRTRRRKRRRTRRKRRGTRRRRR